MPQVAIQRGSGPGRGTWLVGDRPVEVVCARRGAEVLPALEAVAAAAARGLHAAGYIAYEAAPGLDGDLCTHPGAGPPLVWFALFRELREVEDAALPSGAAEGVELGPWEARVTPEQHRAAVERIQAYIAAGDTYQVNYTFALEAAARDPSATGGDPWPLFRRLAAAQRAHHAAYLDTGRWVICSASPERFFTLDGERIVTQPMKGTAPRGLTFAADQARRDGLAQSAKDRAENAMIVDMMRNDLGRIAVPGSVQVTSAFDVERYPTVYQMTSTVTARTTAGFVDILRALFPCASVTGAPKIRTMQIIRALEGEPRGVYTGAIGWLGPGRQAQFNVAIRTVTLDRATGRARYGVGGGIVCDSRPDAEYAECQTKAAVLGAERPAFELLETLLYEGRARWFLLDGHLRRLAQSAEYFDFVLDVGAVRARLDALARELGDQPRRVRLRAGPAGALACDVALLDPNTPPVPWRLRVAPAPVNRDDPFLYHKTTHRRVYERARAACPDGADVVLWNDAGEATETTIANLVVELAGRRYTPPVECGLLPGVFRAHLLATGEMEERIITLDDLRRATRLWCINSVRRWVPAVVG